MCAYLTSHCVILQTLTQVMFPSFIHQALTTDSPSQFSNKEAFTRISWSTNVLHFLSIVTAVLKTTEHLWDTLLDITIFLSGELLFTHSQRMPGLFTQRDEARPNLLLTLALQSHKLNLAGIVNLHDSGREQKQPCCGLFPFSSCTVVCDSKRWWREAQLQN